MEEVERNNDMRKTKPLILCLTVFMMLLLCACGTTEKDMVDPELTYLDELVYGTYYVRHIGNECEAVYFGDASFGKGNVADMVSTGRLSWYKEDWEEMSEIAND